MEPAACELSRDLPTHAPSKTRRVSRVTGTIGEKLARCGGYTVRDPGGKPLGKVAWVRYTTRADCPDTLVVRAVSSLSVRSRTAEISTDRVHEVDPTLRTVTLA
jgi:hypothetical protein